MESTNEQYQYSNELRLRRASRINLYFIVTTNITRAETLDFSLKYALLYSLQKYLCSSKISILYNTFFILFLFLNILYIISMEYNKKLCKNEVSGKNFLHRKIIL